MKNTPDDQLQQLLRAAFPPSQDQGPSHDLWQRIERRLEGPASWSWFDVGLAVCAAAALFAVPGSFMLIAYHL